MFVLVYQMPNILWNTKMFTKCYTIHYIHIFKSPSKCARTNTTIIGLKRSWHRFIYIHYIMSPVTSDEKNLNESDVIMHNIWSFYHFISIDDSCSNASAAWSTLPRHWIEYIFSAFPTYIPFGASVILSETITVAHKTSKTFFIDLYISEYRIF